MTLDPPKRPRSKLWRPMTRPPGLHNAEAWQHRKRRIRVISQLTDMQLPQQPDGVEGMTWLISVSHAGTQRPSDSEVELALRAFDMLGSEEDNHFPGWTRGFFMPVDPAYRVDCECKVDEAIVTEADGYTWSNTVEGCRGCDWERSVVGRIQRARCPIHNERKR